MAPTLNVVITNYNHDPFLNEKVSTLFLQTYHDFEVIILNDCSTDNSKEVIELFRDHQKESRNTIENMLGQSLLESKKIFEHLKLAETNQFDKMIKIHKVWK